MQNSWKTILQIAFTYIGTVVGAGFASGREILEFFVRFGPYGLVGIGIASLLFVWSAIQVMLVAQRIQAKSYQEVSFYLFGKTIGTFFNTILLLVLIGTTSVMLAFTGSLFKESFHLPAQLGIWVSMIFIFLVTARGMGAIHMVNSIFVPILIGFTLLVFFYTKPWDSTASVAGLPLDELEADGWLQSPVYYVSLNVALAQAVLVPIGRECPYRRTLIYGGLVGGLGIGLLLFLAYASLLDNMPHVQFVDTPTIFILSGLGKTITFLFALLVYAEVFSSLVANLFGLVEQVKSYINVHFSLILLIILLICYGVSFVGFSSLLTILYPLFGQIVVFFLVMLFYRQMMDRSKQLN
ncbi:MULTISPECIES: YkvI family membrane protein [Brevibacillus]|uniref:YkvI family membrane protein n=1 Tax=Brevibacillus TaxID=55080 RepID=UPI0002403922|nr:MULTISPECIES: membrane protein [Brevibacillus]MBA4532380.1 hypothetical protein [Brevibacillus halotolerans]PCN45880.1 hypothetical protein B9C88_04135 [Brevibacillus laterosporus]CCF13864.1 putative membrane protein [Brevibacillus laterosporus GI-9]